MFDLPDGVLNMMCNNHWYLAQEETYLQRNKSNCTDFEIEKQKRCIFDLIASLSGQQAVIWI